MFNGQFIITIDPDVINQALYTDSAKVLYLSDEDISRNPLIELGCNTIKSSILLPPYDSVCAELDNEVNLAIQIYIEYLSSSDVDMFICMILKALMNGSNIILYPGHDEADMPFIPVFLQYLTNYFGIIVGSPYEPTQYDYRAFPVILNKLYLHNLIDYQTLFILYPVDAPIMENIIPKLIQDINPYVSNPSMQEYIEYFERYKYRVKQNGNKVLKTVITRG